MSASVADVADPDAAATTRRKLARTRARAPTRATTPRTTTTQPRTTPRNLARNRAVTAVRRRRPSKSRAGLRHPRALYLIGIMTQRISRVLRIAVGVWLGTV